MPTPEDELAAVEAALPATWLPDLPLVERIERLVTVRRAYWRNAQIEHLRNETLAAQRDSMRAGYLGLLTYGLRVATLECAVSQLLAQAEKGTMKMVHVNTLRAAREELGEPHPVEVPNKELGLLEPFLRGKTKSIMLTGERLEALRAVLRWAHGLKG